MDDPALIFDTELSRTKIALVNRETGTVLYGIDSLLCVIANRFPLIHKIGMFPPVHFLLRLLYSFISYNRKVIAPSDCNGNCGCTPARSISRRIVFIAVCGLLVNCITGAYFSHHLQHYFIADPLYTDILFFTAQFISQYVFFRLFRQSNFSDYAGNLAVVSLLGALLLLFFHFGLQLLAFFGVNVEMLQPLCFGIVLMCVFREHTRRLKLLHLSPWLSITWILFRLLIYPFAFIL